MNDTIKIANEKIKAKFIIPDDEININDLRTESSPSVCSNPDAFDVEKSLLERYQYRLAKEIYDDFAIKHLAYVNHKNRKHITLWFKDRSSLVDKGNTITANGGTEQKNAERMIELAKLKNWKRICFSGTDTFLREAFRQAIENNLEVVAEGAAQEKLLLTVKTEIHKSAVASAIKTELARSPIFQKSNQTKPNNKKGMRI